MKNEDVKMGVAGVRGIVKGGFSKELVRSLAQAFGIYIGGGNIIVGMDTRESGPMFSDEVSKGLQETECHVIRIGIVSTPTCQQAVRHHKAQGGIMVTASHNPIEYNGLKFISPEGMFLNEIQMRELFALHKALTPEQILGGGSETTYENAPRDHADYILKLIDCDLIRNAGFHIVVDPVNGAGIPLDKILFEELGVEVTYIHGDPNGKFERMPEPLPQNLTALSNAVREKKALLGFAQDPDADRLALVDETGRPIGEDYTLVLAEDYLLSKSVHPAKETVIANLSTSRAFDDVAKKYGAQMLRTKIGEVYVSEALRDHKALMGGETNGGVIVPAVGWGRDSFMGMSLVLERLARKKSTLSQWVNELPKYVMVKDKIDLTPAVDLSAIYLKIKKLFPEANFDERDGLKADLPHGWIQVRPSNTEPIVRIFAEASTKEEAQALVQQLI